MLVRQTSIVYANTYRICDPLCDTLLIISSFLLGLSTNMNSWGDGGRVPAFLCLGAADLFNGGSKHFSVTSHLDLTLDEILFIHK